jgi:hypothetical protein
MLDMGDILGCGPLAGGPRQESAGLFCLVWQRPLQSKEW